MTQNSFTKTETTILSALSKGIAGEKYVAQKDIDWQESFNEAKAQSVCLAVFDALSEDSSIPKEILEKCKRILRKKSQKRV